MATSGYMLLASLAMTTGVTMTNPVLGLGFKSQLQRHSRGDGATEVNLFFSVLWFLAKSARSFAAQPQTPTSLPAWMDECERLWLAVLRPG